MKHFLLIVSFLLSLFGWACGFDEPERNGSYTMYNQDLVLSPTYDHFLYYPDEAYNLSYVSFASSDGNPLHDSRYQENLNLWVKSFPHWSKKEIIELLFSDPSDQLKKNHQTPTDQLVFEYARFAKSIEQSPTSYQNPWRYKTYLNNMTYSFIEYIQLGLEKFRTEKNPALKQRYGYQVIKLLRYNKDYKAAFHFFETEIKNQFEKNEIYYYTIDQLAGCYYNLKQFKEALNLFIQVFTHSKDRKNSAYLSYMFCLNHVNPETLFEKNQEERLNFYLLKSMSDFNDPIAILKAIKSIDLNDERLKVVFARNITYLDRFIWDTSDDKWNSYNRKTIEDLLSFANTMKNQSQDTFWLYSYAYLKGVNGQYKTAIAHLKTITHKAFIKDRDDLIFLFDAMQWKSTSDIKLSYFNGYFEFTTHQNIEDYTYSDNDVHHYIKDHVLFKLYYQDKKYAEAFLINNNFGVQIAEHALIDILMTFVDKPNKNPLEKLLMKNADKTPKNELKYHKGNLHLIDADFEKALNIFPKSPQTYEIPNLIFSNTLKICFSCPAQQIMKDSVYLDSNFDFIPEKMNSKTLAGVLLKLEHLSHSDSGHIAHLSNYLLGNFYNNISNTGYYRGILWAHTNCCKGDYLRNESPYSYRKEHHFETKFSNLYYPHTAYFALAKKATKYYEKTLEHITDKEFRAKIIFLIAQSTQNYIDNITIGTIDVYDNDYYLQTVFPDTTYYLRHSELVKEMNTTYKDTEFRSKIIKACSYFNVYNQ